MIYILFKKYYIILMGKIAIVSLKYEDIKINTLKYFENASEYGFYYIKSTQDIEFLIEDLKNKYEKILIVNGIEDIEEYNYFSFNFYKGKDVINNDIKILQNVKITCILEELINNSECQAVNTLGIVKNKIDNLQDCVYLDNDNGGIFTLASNSSNIYITYNCLNIIPMKFSHFNLIYNEPYKHKVAICLWGNLDSWTHTKGSFINYILSKIDADIFVYTYKDHEKTDDHIKDLFKDLPVKEIRIEEYKALSSTIKETTNGLTKYKGFNTRINDPITGNSTCKGIVDYGKIDSFIKCNDLRKNYQKQVNVSYDIVLNCNINLSYFCPIDLKTIQENYIYTCYGVLYSSIDHYFLLSEPYIMDVICQNLKNIDKLLERNKDIYFDINNIILAIINENKFNIGHKIINCSLQKDENVIYKHPNTWTYVSSENLEFFNNISNAIQDIYKIQKYKDDLLKQ